MAWHAACIHIHLHVSWIKAVREINANAWDKIRATGKSKCHQQQCVVKHGYMSLYNLMHININSKQKIGRLAWPMHGHGSWCISHCFFFAIAIPNLVNFDGCNDCMVHITFMVCCQENAIAEQAITAVWKTNFECQSMSLFMCWTKLQMTINSFDYTEHEISDIILYRFIDLS